MRQKGFATLEIILMVMVIGILASIAVPRFTSITASANTAKIQSDLTTIDTAIAIYIMEKGTDTAPSLGATGTLKDYIQDIGNLKPPTGSAYIGSDTPTKITDTNYVIKNKGTESAPEYRATLDEHTAGEFTKKASQ